MEIVILSLVLMLAMATVDLPHTTRQARVTARLKSSNLNQPGTCRRRF